MADSEFNDAEYFARKGYWEEILSRLGVRNETHEEYCALVNAMEDRLDELR